MKAAELIDKVQKHAKAEGISALAACKALKIPQGRYYAAVSRENKRGKAPKRVGASAKAATRRQPAAGTWRVTATQADGGESAAIAQFIGTPAQVADFVRALK